MEGKQCRPWSDCFFRSILIRVYTACIHNFFRNFGVQNLKTFTILTFQIRMTPLWHVYWMHSWEWSLSVNFFLHALNFEKCEGGISLLLCSSIHTLFIHHTYPVVSEWVNPFTLEFITKTHLFKYIENFTSKNRKFLDKTLIFLFFFFIFLLKT